MSNGVPPPIDGVALPACGFCELAVAAVPEGADDEDVAGVDGIVNDIPRSAAIGCHGLRADRLNSLPVILDFLSDLQKIKIY
jgi:hypothetical protein